MEKHIIFEDEHIRAIFMPGTSKELVFSFGDLITRAKGLSINAEKSLNKHQFNVIGIMPKQKTWFPAASMFAMWAEIQKYCAAFQIRIGYGGSMGGYAAIKYANLLDLTRIVALVPQYSIDPQDVTDLRYNMFFQAELNENMRVMPQDIDLAREYIIVYDPYCPEDHLHYQKLNALLGSSLHTLNLPFTGHDAVAILASSELLHDFLIRDFDEMYFYQKMRQVKKNSKFYYRKVIEQLLTRHSSALGKILKNNDIALDDGFFDSKLKQALIRELLNKKQVDQQDLEKLGIQINLPVEQHLLLIDHFGHALVYNVISQKIEGYSADIIALNHKFLIPLGKKNHALLSIHLNGENFLLMMNDRHIIKLYREDEDLSLGMHPLILKKYSDFYQISYKDLNLTTDEFGATYFMLESSVMNRFDLDMSH